jgi:hypothetical protein
VTYFRHEFSGPVLHYQRQPAHGLQRNRFRSRGKPGVRVQLTRVDYMIDMLNPEKWRGALIDGTYQGGNAYRYGSSGSNKYAIVLQESLWRRRCLSLHDCSPTLAWARPPVRSALCATDADSWLSEDAFSTASKGYEVDVSAAPFGEIILL